MTRDFSQLTDRQQEVCRLAAIGWSRKEIAARIGISKKTVDRHLEDSYRQLGLRGIINLVHYLLAIKEIQVDFKEVAR